MRINRLLQCYILAAVLSFAFSALAQAPDPLPPADFFAQVLAAIRGFGGLSTMLKISAILVLVVSSMKVSFLNQWVWSKLGAAQVFFAPLLGLAAGLLGLGAGGQAVTPALVFAYLMAGGGAVFMHEILDFIKAVPGLGAIWLALIQLIEGALGGPGAAKK